MFLYTLSLTWLASSGVCQTLSSGCMQQACMQQACKLVHSRPYISAVYGQLLRSHVQCLLLLRRCCMLSWYVWQMLLMRCVVLWPCS